MSDQSRDLHVSALLKTAKDIARRAKQVRTIAYHADSIIANCRSQYEAIRFELTKYGVDLPEFDEAIFMVPRSLHNLADIATYITSRDIRAKIIDVKPDPVDPKMVVVYLNKQLSLDLVKKLSRRVKRVGGEVIDQRRFRLPKEKAAPWVVA